MMQRTPQWNDGEIIKKERLEDPAEQIALYRVTYSSQGLQVKGYLVIPEREEPCPAMIYCRGGIRNVGMVRVARIVQLAQHGYIIFAPFYRGNEGGEGKEDFAGEDRYDVYHAIPLLQTLPEVDQNTIAIFGFSRGAMMALLAARDCPQIGPAVVWGGVSDLFLTYEERVDLRKMLKRVVGHPKKDKEAYQSRSPVHWIEEVNKPILIVHGTEDVKVGVEHAYRLERTLKDHNKIHSLWIFEGLGHVFPTMKDEETMDRVFCWIRDQTLN